ncbi:hypothetical protein QZH56_08055 [Streptomyces olivoreticuli]|uniref:hypothetical protein n=1 Tax=Streptomyces olivoreticuli TaxID=68246 RepID=UPI0026597B15|nr:hypothetical protein [Streptomyces olivoreticuli]WKK25539.1 hypothetical protein QZH56_08055 [Streptomyces olivoreticuli]
MTTDLSLLTTAAENWDAAAKDFEKAQKAYDSQVKSVGFDGSWTGEANLYARPNMQQTSEQYTAAAKEARAVASLLRDAHTQFTELRGKLKSVVADAEKAGFKVGEDGTVSSAAPSDRAALHDPDYQAELAKVASARSDWAQKIADMVTVFDDADHGVRMALTTAVQDTDLFDSTANGFNAKAEGDLEKVEAKETIRLAEKLKSGKKLDAEELAEAPWLFRDVAQDKKASRLVLDAMGPDGTIELTNRLNGLADSGDKGHREAYDAIRSGLAGTVSAATADTSSPFYDKWREGLRKAGTKNFGSKTDPVYGYQSFVGLMEHNKRYGTQFLNDLGDDIIAAEKKDKDVWTKWRDHPGTASDPLDHLLGVMSKNPDAATSFLDPGAEGKNDHLGYLLKDRHWPKVAMNGPGALLTQNDPTTKAGLGLAIEAAATGHAPLAEGVLPNPEARHNQAQARIMHDTIGLVDPGSSTAAPANLRRPLTNALAEYSTDTHEILSGNTEYGDKDGVWDGRGRVNMSADQGKLLRTLRGLSEDPDAYATLHRAESDHIDHELDKVSADAKGYHQKNPLTKAGTVLGSYSAIREDIINDQRSSDYSAADWKAKVAYHIIGGALTPVTIGPSKIPIGDSLQRGVDTWAWEWSNNMKADADAEANSKIADHYMESNRQMRLMIKGWAQNHHISEDDSGGRDIIEGMTGDVAIGSTTGVDNAKHLLK